MERSEIEARAKPILLTALRLEESTLRPDLNVVEDTEADSLDVMEVFLGLEEGLEVEFPPEDQAARAARARELASLGPEDDEAFAVDLERFAAAQEMVTGMAVIPVGVVGPVRVELGRYERSQSDGQPVEVGRAAEDLHIPLAHTEGGLTASLYRGAYASAEDGGVRTYVVADGMTRDSCFEFASVAEALAAARYVESAVPAMRAWLQERPHDFVSRYAVLQGVETHVVGPWCHVL